MPKHFFAIEEVKDERNIDIQSWFQERLPMLQEEHFQGKRCRTFFQVSHIPLLSVGFNCALGPDLLKPYLQTLSQNTSCFSAS
jgi:5-methyltetrahydrofolate--homocysteine methyltransferase